VIVFVNKGTSKNMQTLTLDNRISDPRGPATPVGNRWANARVPNSQKWRDGQDRGVNSIEM